jgi:DNA invertase Pin-like site-specific DNA recombinase
MKLGYARVSTNEQDTAAQVSALKSAGCEKIFRDPATVSRLLARAGAGGIGVPV